jgi:hypothetical protein
MSAESHDPPPDVQAAFAAFPDDVRPALLELRTLIFDVAGTTVGVGRLEETLKWGQPAYLTPQTRSGTTIRLGVPRTGGFGIFVHCRTRVIPEFRALFPDDFTYDGSRGVLMRAGAPIPADRIRLLIASALTYHLA